MFQLSIFSCFKFFSSSFSAFFSLSRFSRSRSVLIIVPFEGRVDAVEFGAEQILFFRQQQTVLSLAAHQVQIERLILAAVLLEKKRLRRAVDQEDHQADGVHKSGYVEHGRPRVQVADVLVDDVACAKGKVGFN